MSARIRALPIRLSFVLCGLLTIAGSDASAQATPVVKRKHIDATVLRIAARKTKGTDNPVAGGVVAGHQIAGAFGPASPRLRNGSHYQQWLYKGRAGERISILMRSTEFASYLLLARGSGGESETIAEDDGSAGDDAHISAKLPANGEYKIFATTAEPGKIGRYNLVVDSKGVAAQPNWSSIYRGGGSPAERYALIVGIDDYPGDENDLDGPTNDARIMRDLLITKYAFRPENIVTLTDTGATREAISNAFLRHLGQAGPDGVAVFYYSGHGMQTESNEGIQPPLDPEPDSKDESIVVWGDDDDVSFVLDDELGFLADRVGAGRMMVILDACFSGTGTRAPGGPKPKVLRMKDVQRRLRMPKHFLVDRLGRPTASALSAGLKNARTPAKRGDAGSGSTSTADILGMPQRHVLLTASADNEVSWTNPDWPGRSGSASVFTYFLADVLTADTGSESIAALMKKVRDKAVPFSRNHFETVQTPQVEGSRINETLSSFLGKH